MAANVNVYYMTFIGSVFKDDQGLGKSLHEIIIQNNKEKNIFVLVNVSHYVLLLQAVKCSDSLMSKVTSHNRRTLDMLAAKCYFYHSRAYEITGQLDKIRGCVRIVLTVVVKINMHSLKMKSLNNTIKLKYMYDYS